MLDKVEAPVLGSAAVIVVQHDVRSVPVISALKTLVRMISITDVMIIQEPHLVFIARSLDLHQYLVSVLFTVEYKVGDHRVNNAVLISMPQLILHLPRTSHSSYDVSTSTSHSAVYLHHVTIHLIHNVERSSDRS